MVIDFHAHCYPDNLAERAFSRMNKSENMYCDGKLSGLMQSMEKTGIDICVALHVASKISSVKSVNSFAEQINSDKVISFPSIHPLAPDALEEVDRLHQLGFKGIKFHPAFQDFPCDDPRCIPVYERIGSYGMISVFHGGLSILSDTSYCAPKMMASILPVFGGAPVVSAHLGARLEFDDVIKYLVGKNVYFDTALCVSLVKPDDTKRIIDLHGPDKILFGTDWPWGPQKPELDYIYELKLPSDVEEMILYKNAMKLLNI